MMIKKLVTFEDLGFVQWGVLNEAEDGVYGAIALEEAFFTPLPETMLEFIRQGNDGLLALADALEQNEKTGAVKAKPLDTVRIMAPIPHMERNIFCIGKNYTEHIAEFDKTAMPKPPKYPVIFTKATSSVIGRMTSSTLIRTSRPKSTMKRTGRHHWQGRLGYHCWRSHGSRLRLYHPQRRHGTGPAGQPRPVVPRQEPGYVLLSGRISFCAMPLPTRSTSSRKSTMKFVRTARQANSSSPSPN